MQSIATRRAFPISLAAIVAAMTMALLFFTPVSANAVLTASLTGAQEVPPSGSTATGNATITVLDNGSICWNVTFSGLDGDLPNLGHIHRGAAGVIGPVVVDFGLSSPTPSPIVGCNVPSDATRTLAAEIETTPANFYVNLHNIAFPGGVIRGQLVLGTALPPVTASSYINPDTGAATANNNVEPGSSCEAPDQFDTQVVSPPGTVTNNVHNDACLFDALGNDVDTTVSFESSGVGVISGCPDPDGAGPKMSTNSGTRCTQTGFQIAGAPGPFEYHARLNSEVSGTQTVVFCADPELPADGCANATITDTITIQWTGPAATAASYINPDTGAATANTDVNANSTCETQDNADTQTVSPSGSTANNVHNDACIFDAGGLDVDTTVSFESSGVGVISACPDPDAAGPKTSTNSGTRCTQTGYQVAGAPGPFEYHARLNSQVAGTQTVLFCADPEGNGCGDATITDTITITWVAAVAAASPTPAATALPNTAVIDGTATDGTALAAAILGAIALASVGTIAYRARGRGTR